METLIQYFNESSSIWEEYSYTDRADIDVSEVWQDSAGRLQPLSHQPVPQHAIGSWLDNVTRQGSGNVLRMFCRMVWVPRVPAEKTNDISFANARRIIQSFGLDIANKLYRTTSAGAFRFPPSDNFYSYCFCVHPKIVLLWSFNPVMESVQGICFAGEGQIEQMKKIWSIKKNQSDQNMLLALLCNAMLSAEVDASQKNIKSRIREVEVRTGYHIWINRSEAAAEGDLPTLSAKMSGGASKTAAVLRKIMIIEESCRFMLEQLALQQAILARSDRSDEIKQLSESNYESLKDDLEILGQRVKMQKIDTVFIEKRITVQLSALSNLIAQNDSLVGLEIAADSKLLASASQQDSSSMKTLAAVTMVFLPGTFVASLFAVPLFNWDAGYGVSHNVIKPRFPWYWAVTIPLTVLTLLVWGGWSKWQFVQHRNKQKSAFNSLNVSLSEVGALVRRRTNTFPPNSMA